MSIQVVVVGKLTDPEGFRQLAEEMVAVAGTEDGTTVYEWHVSPNGAFRNEDAYEDDAAFLAHFQNFGPHAERYMQAVDIERVDVIGDVNDATREILDQWGANYHEVIASLPA